jgi:hypothetical protein
VICIESKFVFDAKEGFGACGQVKARKCAGYYGPGSDLVTKDIKANCRLDATDGRRQRRLYWDHGRNYFVDSIFQLQTKGAHCPFAGSNFQLMRNFLLAAEAAKQQASSQFGVLAIVPKKMSGRVEEQVQNFQSILKEPVRSFIGVAYYDEFIEMLVASPHDASKGLGEFLKKRMTQLLSNVQLAEDAGLPGQARQ